MHPQNPYQRMSATGNASNTSGLNSSNQPAGKATPNIFNPNQRQPINRPIQAKNLKNK